MKIRPGNKKTWLSRCRRCFMKTANYVFRLYIMLHFISIMRHFLCCRACKIEIICILLDKDALVSKIIIIFAVAFSCRKPKGPSGWVYFYEIERLLTLICAIVNFATLLAVSRCGNEWMLTVGVFLYPAANRRIYTVALCYGIIYVIRIRMRIFIYHSVGFLHCPSQWLFLISVDTFLLYKLER